MVGAQQTITDQLTDAAAPAGQAAGKAAGTSMSEALGKKMGTAGGALTKGVTVPLTAIGTAAVASWKEVDAGLDTIVQKTGASGETLEDMSNVLHNITTTIPTDFATAGEAIGEVNTRFGLTGEALDKLSTQFIKFAKLNGTDVSNSVDTVQKALSAFGLTADDAESLLDALNAAGQATGASVDTLANGLIQNATAFQELGLSIEQSTALMGQMEMSGANSETVMQGLRKALKNAAEDGIPLNDALSELQDTILNGKDGVDGLTAAYDLFGKSGDQIYGAIKNGTLNFAELGAAATDTGGSVSAAFEGTLDPMDDFQTTMNELKLLGADLVTAAGPALKEAIGGISDVVSKLSEAWNGLSPEMQDAIIKLAGIAAVAGPVLMIGSKIVGGISTLVGGIGSLTGGLGGLGGAAAGAAGPVASAGGSFGTMAGQALKMIAAAAALYIAAQAISVLVDAAIRIDAAGGRAIAVLAGMAVGIGALMAVAAACGPALTAGAVGIGVFGASLLAIGAGIDLACAGIARVTEAISGLVATISSNAEGINSIVTNVGETVNGTITTITDGITNVTTAIGGAISSVLDSLSGVISSIGQAALDAGTGFEKLAGAVKDLTNGTSVFDLAGTLGSVAKGVKDINGAASGAGQAAGQVKALAKSFSEMAKTAQVSSKTLAMFGTSTKSTMTTASSAIRGANLGRSMTTAVNNAYSAAKTGLRKISSAFSSTNLSFKQHISVPHFSMSGSFNAETKSTPSVSVSWYAKAAEYGALFTSPQIIGVGDAAQPELLIGTEKLREMFKDAGQTNIFNITVDGAESPEDYADRLVRQLKLKVRTA